MVQTAKFQLAPGFTTIENSRGVVFIDYKNGLLIRFGGLPANCQEFPMQIDESMDRYMTSRLESFSEITVLSGSKTKTVLFGRRVLLSRPAVIPAFEAFGSEFIPGTVQYSLDTSHQDWEKIREIANHNLTGFTVNPLLDQIDISRLAPLLGGIVVGQHKKGQKLTIQYSLKEEKEQRQRLEELCR